MAVGIEVVDVEIVVNNPVLRSFGHHGTPTVLRRFNPNLGQPSSRSKARSDIARLNRDRNDRVKLLCEDRLATFSRFSHHDDRRSDSVDGANTID